MIAAAAIVLIPNALLGLMALAVQVLDRSTWRMPPLFNLAPPEHSTARNIGLLVLRGYLFW